jgi:hypothetical protein
VPPKKDDRLQVPEDLTGSTADELKSLLEGLTAKFDELMDSDEVTGDSLAEAERLADSIAKVKGEQETRAAAQAELNAKREEIRARVHESGAPESEQPEVPASEAEQTDEEGEVAPVPAQAAAPAVDTTAIAASVAGAIGKALAPVLERLAPAPTAREVSLARAQAVAPRTPVPAGSKLVITAGGSNPKLQQGRRIDDMAALGEAFFHTSKAVPRTATGQVGGVLVASLQNEFEHVIDDGRELSPNEWKDLLHSVITDEAKEALVAGGGWCAPSTIRYDFFNVACEDGLIDLPTIGITRGGIRFPTSPSMADVFTGTFTSATNPWLWTETDDIVTVTGGPNKPCIRVPCPSFNEVRLECYGVCLTAGNLTDNAYPEATQNFLRLLLSAHEHAMNQRFIQSMVALTTAPVVSGGGGTDANAISIDLPANLEWNAIDYRARYGMCETDVLEAVFPYWLRAVIRADIAGRTGRDQIDVSDAEINGLFTTRGVRPQWVKDWQVRGTNQPGGATPTTLYPASVDYMLYAAGTFVKGNGMSLDLGVVRDSVLNAENDHTAAWSEECHLIARVGHEARLYRQAICAAGRTGAAAITDCRTS